MNMASLIIIAVIALLVYVCIRYLAENGLDSCSGDCSSCGPNCRWARDIRKAQKAIARKKKLRKLLHLD